MSANIAALLLCILGVPDPNKPGKRKYPSIDESFAYIQGTTKELLIQETEEEPPLFEVVKATTEPTEDSKQLCLFA